MKTNGQYLDELIISTIRRHQIEVERERLLGTFIRIQYQDVPLADQEIYPGIWMRLPQNFILKKGSEIKSGYLFKNHPEKLLTSGCGSVNFTFDRSSQEETAIKAAENIKRIMAQKYPQNSIYEEGRIRQEGFTVHWFDFKSTAADSDVYNIMFLFEKDPDIIIGTFKCAFVDYQEWKSYVVKMLGTITKPLEGGNCR